MIPLWFLLGFSFDPEDEGNIFFRNIYSMDYEVLYSEGKTVVGRLIYGEERK
jgi:hypothetical protein